MSNPYTTRDRTIIRELARRVADAAADPVMETRRNLWCEHNSLRECRPMLLIFPECGWSELLPDASLQCESEDARGIERELRQQIYTHEHFSDDTVCMAEWVQPAILHSTGWGLKAHRHESTEIRGSWGFDPVLKGSGDLKKMHYPDITHDEAATDRRLQALDDLFGDILRIVRKGLPRCEYHLPQQYIYLRGLNEMLMDMMDRPEFVHEVMRFFTEGHKHLFRQYLDMGLLSLNNDNTYNNSGGNGWTDTLPAADFDGQHVRPADVWACAESQEFAVVSPEMHAEFTLQYEKELLAPFGLNGYGCCEDLTNKLDLVFEISNIRRISISPWANVAKCAEKLKGDYIFSWKPNPAMLVGQFNEQAVREYIASAVAVCRSHGCRIEIILKDTHTCQNHPERFDRWSQIARDVIESL